MVESGAPLGDAAVSSADLACGQKTGFVECRACCQTNHPRGDRAYEQAFAQCACQAGRCQTECGATYCTTFQRNPGDACARCLRQETVEDACGPAAEQACDKEPDCLAEEACFLAAKCREKS